MPYFASFCGQPGRVGLALCLCLLASLAQAITKPDFDHREYRHIRLGNGLEAVMVSDSKARQGAFALEVGVGSFADPEHLGGLAHLVEHAILLGDTSKADGSFRKFVAANRGRQGGQTSYEFTRYQVSLDSQALGEALHRFGDLLKAPRFDATALTREIRIVEEEFSLVKNKLLWRYRQPLKAVTTEHHPFRKFAPGSQESLGHLTPDQLHAEAVRFINDYYTPQRMRLVVVGSQDLPTLERIIRSAFEPLAGNAVALPDYGPLLEPSRLPARVEIRTTGEAQTLNLLIPLPQDPEINHYKPVEYLKYVLDHQGPNSLEKLLRAKGDIHQLHLSSGLGLGGQQTLSVAVALTAQGLERVDSVIADLFSAFAALQEQAVVPELYESFRDLLAVQEFIPHQESPRDLALYLLKQQHHYPIPDVLRGEFVAAPFNGARISDFLKALNPDNALVILAHNQAKTNQVSAEYGIAFGAQEVSQKQLSLWRQAPTPVNLVRATDSQPLPRDLRVEQKPNDPQPTLVYQTERVQLWHAFNRMGNTPRSVLRLGLQSPDFGSNLADRTLGELWLKILEKRLEPLQQQAAPTGQKVEIYSHGQGLTLKISSFRDQTAILTRDALQRIFEPVSPDEFAVASARLQKQLTSPRYKYAFESLVEELKSMLVADRWSTTDMSGVLPDLSLNRFQVWQQEVREKMTFAALSFGQVDARELDALHLLLNNSLAKPGDEFSKGAGLLKTRAEPALDETVKHLPNGARYTHQLPLHGSENALVFYHQGSQQGDEQARLREEAILRMLTPLLRNSYFEEVRNRRQLAYGVLVVPINLMETPGLGFIIQSRQSDPALLTEVTDQFLDEFSSYLRQLDHHTFQGLKTSLLKDLSSRAATAEDMESHFWQEIGRRHQDFSQNERLAEAVRQIKPSDLISYVEQELSGDQERSVILQGWSQQLWPPKTILAEANRPAPGLNEPKAAGNQTGGRTTPTAISSPAETPLTPADQTLL